MKNIVTHITVLACFCLFATQAMALDLGIERSKNKPIERHKSFTTRGNKTKKKSEGQKTTSTTSTGSDQQDQNVIRRIGQQMRNSGLDVTLSLGDIFLQSLAMLEKQGNMPRLRARILSDPRKPASFGLSAEIQPGVIDSIKADLLTKMAGSDAAIEMVGGDEKKIHKYRNNLALYGVIIAQAYLYLSNDLAALNDGVTKDETGKIIIKNLGYDDLQILADGALLRAVQHIKNKRLKELYTEIISDERPCRFAGTVSSIQCGSSAINLSIPPTLNALGVTVFAPDRFAGFSGQYRVSSGWSYNHSLEALKNTSKYKKQAEEVSDYTDEMESRGNSREALKVKKIAWTSAKSGKASLALARLIPGL